jgi:hypothetical protein
MQRAIGTYPYGHGTRHACRVPCPLLCLLGNTPIDTGHAARALCLSFFLILPLKVVEGVGGPDSLLFSYIEV